MEKLNVLIQTTPNLYTCAVLVLYANYIVVSAVCWVLVRIEGVTYLHRVTMEINYM